MSDSKSARKTKVWSIFQKKSKKLIFLLKNSFW